MSVLLRAALAWPELGAGAASGWWHEFLLFSCLLGAFIMWTAEGPLATARSTMATGCKSCRPHSGC